MADTARLTTALGDRYQIERELGAGGMATVYLAKDLKHEREVALKVLRPELGAVLGSERFLSEIKITARLDHPHILTLIDSGASEGFLYYVLPYVRGESLREKLNREKQLSMEEALQITKQVASALDYAHRHGVVHRDIKPENILIQEGEAMLADFGIALAVKEAGGNRLTETGLSLGTPQYMSPEQATGDRQLDARSDVYSLAAVLYEMLAGEPPVTGPTAQAMIAKLMTERPTHLRVVRDTVPEGIDAAVAKALAKTPADRFASAGDFNRALEVRAPSGETDRRRPRTLLTVAAVLGILVVAVLGTLIVTGKLGRRGPERVLAARTQLTFTGAVLNPAISPDGKQLAYFTKDCTAASCTYAVEVQDVGGTATRRILEHLSAAYGLEWSPDRRNLIAGATINGHWGAYLLSALGGTPRFLGPGAVTFYAGGDSLLMGPESVRRDTVFWVRVATLDGAVRDSIRVAGAGTGITALAAIPGTGWIVSLIPQAPRGLWQIMDRHGRVVDHVVNDCTCGGSAASDALWLIRAGASNESIVRVPLDPGTGHLGARHDTMFSGTFTGFSVTADGASAVIDDGTYEYSTWALELADALHGRFPDARRVLRTSTPSSALISPDGARLLVRRTLPAGAGRTEDHLSVRAFDGGPETPINTPGAPVGAFWADSTNVAVSVHTPHGLRLVRVDVRSGAQRLAVDLPDSTVTDFEPLPDGWAWIPAGGDRVMVQRGAQSRTIPKPPGAAVMLNISAATNGRHVVVTSWNASTIDTLLVDELSVDDGTDRHMAAAFGEAGSGRPLPDGSILFNVFPTQETATFYRVRQPDRLESLGTIPRPIRSVRVSNDLKRATVGVRDYHGDAWMSRVVRP